jgi:hypothetical protein
MPRDELPDNWPLFPAAKTAENERFDLGHTRKTAEN